MPPDELEEPDDFDQALVAYDEALCQSFLEKQGTTSWDLNVELPATASWNGEAPPSGDREDLAACQRCLDWLEAIWPRQWEPAPESRFGLPSRTSGSRSRSASGTYQEDAAEVGAGTELGPLLILEELGRGGMGIVYKALDRRQNVHLALKMLSEHGQAAVRRIKHEFRVLAEILHPNLVLLEELYLVDQQWFFTMELVEGQPLTDYVRGSRSRLPSGTWGHESESARLVNGTSEHKSESAILADGDFPGRVALGNPGKRDRVAQVPLGKRDLPSACRARAVRPIAERPGPDGRRADCAAPGGDPAPRCQAVERVGDRGRPRGAGRFRAGGRRAAPGGGQTRRGAGGHLGLHGAGAERGPAALGGQ